MDYELEKDNKYLLKSTFYNICSCVEDLRWNDEKVWNNWNKLKLQTDINIPRAPVGAKNLVWEIFVTSKANSL